MQLGNFFLMFRSIILPSSSGLWAHELTRNPKDDGSTFFTTLERSYPNTGCNNPEDLVLQYEYTFATTIYWQLCVLFQSVMCQRSRTTRVQTGSIFHFIFPPYLACYTSDGCVFSKLPN
jgi:hypothetical protein